MARSRAIVIAVATFLATSAAEVPRDPAANAALAYWGAWAFYAEAADALRSAVTTYADGRRPAILDPVNEPGAASLDLFRDGTGRPYLDWGGTIERDGPATYLPYVRPMRELSALVRFHAWWAVEGGRPAMAVDDLVALRGAARQWAASPTVIDRLLAMAMEAGAQRELLRLAPRIPAAARSRAVAELAAQPVPPPLSRALAGDRAMVCWVRRHLAGGTEEALKELLGDAVDPGQLAGRLPGWCDELDELLVEAEAVLDAPAAEYPARLAAYRRRLIAANPLADELLIAPGKLRCKADRLVLRGRLVTEILGLDAIDAAGLVGVGEGYADLQVSALAAGGFIVTWWPSATAGMAEDREDLAVGTVLPPAADDGP